MLTAVQGILILLGLAVMREVPLRRALGMLVVGAFALMVALLPLQSKIIERLTGDLGTSVDTRVEGMVAALSMWEDNGLLLGVGHNNYKAHILRYQPEDKWTFEREATVVRDLHLRFPIGPWNGFIFLLAETGLLGLCAFLFYLARVLVIGIRAVAVARGARRCASYGLLLGILGVLGHQITDYSIWIDPVFYAFAVVVGLLNAEPSLSGTWSASWSSAERSRSEPEPSPISPAPSGA
jgi:O-antigen ligase